MVMAVWFLHLMRETNGSDRGLWRWRWPTWETPLSKARFIRDRGDECARAAGPGDFNDPSSLFGSKTKQFLERERVGERKSLCGSRVESYERRKSWVFVSLTVWRGLQRKHGDFDSILINHMSFCSFKMYYYLKTWFLKI